MQANRGTKLLSSSEVSAPSSSSQDKSDPRPGIKRSYSAQARVQPSPPLISALPPPPPAKLPRAMDNTSAFSSARRSIIASPSGRGKNQFRKGIGSTDGAGGPSPLSSQQQLRRADSSRASKRRKHANTARSVHLPTPPKNLLLLEGPFHDEAFIVQEYFKSGLDLRRDFKENPKSPLHNFYSVIKSGQQPKYESVQGTFGKGKEIWRTTVTIDIEPPIVGVGDHIEKKESINLAALSAIYQLQGLNLLENARCIAQPELPSEVTLSDGSVVNYERARSFMDYYCRRFGFNKPETDFNSTRGGANWEAVMTVGERRIGVGNGSNKKQAQVQCYLDVAKYLEGYDQVLWKEFVEASRTGKDLGMARKVAFSASPYIEASIEDLCHDIRRGLLYRNRPSRNATSAPAEPSQSSRWPRIELQATPANKSKNLLESRKGPSSPRRPRRDPQATLANKSTKLLQQRKEYLSKPELERLRKARASLPVYARGKEVLEHIARNDVTICMAATGSGKTTQIPQMLLDDYIDRGEGANCNIICTQPRRLAAISVAHRVAKERNEQLGRCVGYHVRFESKLPEPNGSITFCTTGVFLKRLQSLLSDVDEFGYGELDNISHIIVDEVHERDVDTDLLLVVLKQLMAQKKAKHQSLKIVLMSATIDPKLFQEYFANEQGVPAKTVSVPGRSFPVTTSFLEDFTEKILSGSMKWVKDQENVAKYMARELGTTAAARMGVRVSQGQRERRDDLELPYPFIAATISHVLQSSQDGHVLVFLPGWEEIIATQRALLNPLGPLDINFSSPNYSLHLLHSSIPLTEQQAIFEPPVPGVRRIILATNIAETSITIPDVVYVIDTAKIKEQRYDPDRHMSSLVSSWVGTSNLNQRAGRAGRHRSGEYFGILSKARADLLQTHQTVEMTRVDLSNVVMHVKALNLPGMTVEEVLAAAIEPPDPGRVDAAMKDLQMVGALDSEKNLTSLGRVLLQLPVDAQVGKMVLYGSFFKCLDHALTLAALLTNREPFLSPMHVRLEAQKVKDSWSPGDFRSDVLAALRAFNSWWAMQSRGDYVSANRFCNDNFLSKSTLLLVQKVRMHLLQSLYRAGVVDVSAGGVLESGHDGRRLIVPSALNVNNDSMPLLTALISIAAQPKFAARKDQSGFRTPTDKFAMIHPSSVNNRRREALRAEQSKDKGKQQDAPAEEKRLYAYAEKRRNDTVGSSPTTFLVTTTRLDPLVYILFGAYNVEVVQGGLECDDWLPVKGDLRTLDDIWRLKTSMEASMLRVFEGITMSHQHKRQKLTILPRECEEEAEWESGDEGDGTRYLSLSKDEVRDLDQMTSALVGLLNAFSNERIAAQSPHNSRVATPMVSPFFNASRLPGSGSASGYTTPSYQSRPGTPSRLRR